MSELRTCTGCQLPQPLSEYYFKGVNQRTGRKNGYSARCRECVRRQKRKPRTCLGCGATYFQIGSAGARRRICDACATSGKVCARCDKFKPFDRFYGGPESRGGNRYCRDGCSLAVYREYRYGIGADDHETLAALSSAGCPICRNVDRKLVLDHDHESGAPRALICGKCNSALGMFDDSVDALLGAIAYLRKHSASRA